MDVLGYVAAGVGFDLGQQVAAVAGEAIALAADWVDHYVTHG